MDLILPNYLDVKLIEAARDIIEKNKLNALFRVQTIEPDKFNTEQFRIICVTVKKESSILYSNHKVSYGSTNSSGRFTILYIQDFLTHCLIEIKKQNTDLLYRKNL